MTLFTKLRKIYVKYICKFNFEKFNVKAQILIGENIIDNEFCVTVTNNLTMVLNLVERLPAGHNYQGARAVSTPRGPLVLLERTLYLLFCDNKACSWQKQTQQIDHDSRYGVMMALPDTYSC